MRPSRWILPLALSLAPALAASSFAHAAPTGPELVKALRQGGYVLVMRHANAPATPPDHASADPDNAHAERQLDEAGRAQAHAVGAALHRMGIPIGRVLVSPAYRARETARLAGLPPLQPVEQLSEGPAGMMAMADKMRMGYLRKAAAERPLAGTNTIIITHTPNILAAFGREAKGIAPAEVMVMQPDGHGGSTLVTRLTAQDWMALHR